MMMAILARVWMTGYESANLADVASFVLGLGIGMACRNEVLSPPKVWGAPVQGTRCFAPDFPSNWFSVIPAAGDY